MTPDLQYLRNNFIEWDTVCKQVEISGDKLQDLIARNIIPEPSYTIKSDIKITSALKDEYLINKVEKYFNKNVIKLLQEHKEELTPEEIKTNFRNSFYHFLANHPERSYAYDNILESNGEIDPEKFEKVIEEEWEYYCNGVYGICTLHATTEEIVKKEIAVRKLKDFIQKNGSDNLTMEQKEQLKKLNISFNEIASSFAPYQRENSSRGKYLDKLFAVNSLSELIYSY